MIHSGEGEEIAGRYLHDVQSRMGSRTCLTGAMAWLFLMSVTESREAVANTADCQPVTLYHLSCMATLARGSHAVFRYKNYLFGRDLKCCPRGLTFHHNRIPARGVCDGVDVSDINHPRKVAEYAVPEAARTTCGSRTTFFTWDITLGAGACWMFRGD